MGLVLGVDIPEEDFNVWIAALRSGDYKQVDGRLNKDGGYCCLGVACDVLIPEEYKVRDEEGRLLGGVPVDQIHAPRWLIRINGDFGLRNAEKLIELNDELGRESTDKPFHHVNTFNDIADKLEETYRTAKEEKNVCE